MNDPWILAGGFITIVCVQIGNLLSSYRKDKRDYLNDQIKRDALLSIADTNNKSLVAQTEVRLTLEKTHEINMIRYESMMGAIKHVNDFCKAVGSGKIQPKEVPQRKENYETNTTVSV